MMATELPPLLRLAVISSELARAAQAAHTIGMAVAAVPHRDRLEEIAAADNERLLKLLGAMREWIDHHTKRSDVIVAPAAALGVLKAVP